MKKLILAAVAFLSVGALATLSAQEQGKFTLGANVSMLTENSNFGLGAKLRYGLTDAVRLEGAVNYYLPKDKLSALDLSVNAHYVFPLDAKFSVYPAVGVGVMRYMSSIDGIDALNRFTVNFGGGASYQLNESVSLGAEFKYTLIKSYNTPVFGVNAMFSL